MRKVIAILMMLLLVPNLFSQVRNGWRSIYDTFGRLTRMSFYKNGVDVTDSNFYFQYYTDNVIKGIITGEIVKEGGCRNGSIILFDESGNLASYNVKREGQEAFNYACDYLGVCNGKWVDAFDVNTNCWLSDSFSVENGELILYNEKNIGVALYRPPVPIDLNCEFIFQAKIPRDKNSSKVGVCLGWDGPENYYLFEISYGESYSALCYEDGVYKPLIEGRRPIEKKGDNSNEIRISRNGTNLIVEVNQNIEMVIPAPRFKTSTIGLMTRSKGNARFMDFGFTYSVPKDSWLYTNPKIGKGTGFFISTSGRILTTYDAVAGAKSIFVKGKIGENMFLLSA
ncbi:MAG TPA: hypothetical protein PKH79_07560, partial [Prolixibacteraceae bacterium]|nr:hypothetical protein [Prolixibacteraceae bacterium]